MDLLSLVLTLRLAGAPDPARPVPAWWGRSAHALLLDVVRQSDPALAEALHAAPTDEGQPAGALRPFTVSSLMGPGLRAGLNPANAYWMRFTAFRSDLADCLWQAAQPGGPLAAGAPIELDYIPFRIETAAPAPAQSPAAGPESPWPASTTYQQLSAPYLLAQNAAPRRIALAFTSPTTFKTGGMHLPLPLPELIFGSLLEKWNAFAPLAFPPETRRYAAECLAISQYDLKTRPIPQKSGGLRMGMIGSVALTTLNYDRYWMSVIATLAAFSLFAGVGAGTSQGLGQARPQAENSPPGAEA